MEIYNEDELCVICGTPVPEGRMICANCEERIEKDLEREEELIQK